MLSNPKIKEATQAFEFIKAGKREKAIAVLKKYGVIDPEKEVSQMEEFILLDNKRKA